jgi:DNA-directed RNA polymerase specialized sigma24 family protein
LADCSYAEISDVLDMPVGSIGPTRGRCLERLRELFAGPAKSEVVIEAVHVP